MKKFILKTSVAVQGEAEADFYKTSVAVQGEAEAGFYKISVTLFAKQKCFFEIVKIVLQVSFYRYCVIILNLKISRFILMAKKHMMVWLIMVLVLIIGLNTARTSLQIAISRNFAFVFSAIFSYICIGLVFISYVIFVGSRFLSQPTPLEDFWLFIIFILSAFLASLFDLIGILTTKTKKVRKKYLYGIFFFSVYVFGFLIWYILNYLPNIIGIINYSLFDNLRSLFITLFL